jgi:hypothetical protein
MHYLIVPSLNWFPCFDHAIGFQFSTTHFNKEETDLPTVMLSPKRMEPNTTVKTTDNGVNIGGYAGPCLATTHESRLYFPAVARAPCATTGVYCYFHDKVVMKKKPIIYCL